MKRDEDTGRPTRRGDGTQDGMIAGNAIVSAFPGRDNEIMS